jgi:hypothetical protein
MIYDQRELRAFVLSHCTPEEAAQLRADDPRITNPESIFRQVIHHLYGQIMPNLSPKLKQEIDEHGVAVAADDEEDALAQFLSDSWMADWYRAWSAKQRHQAGE